MHTHVFGDKSRTAGHKVAVDRGKRLKPRLEGINGSFSFIARVGSRRIDFNCANFARIGLRLLGFKLIMGPSGRHYPDSGITFMNAMCVVSLSTPILPDFHRKRN